MSVQVRRRREAASFLQTYVGAQGELLVDTTNNRVQVHDGATAGGWPAAKLADVIGRTTVADAAYTAKTTDRTIAVTSLTAPRTITLPASTAFPTGTTLTIVDESGACATLAVGVAAAGTDTINGLAAWPLATAYGYVALESNGAGRWTVVDAPGTARTAVADTSYQALATDRTIAFTTLTAARTVTLPAAAAYPTGTQLLVVDESGACSFTNTVTVARAGSDTIDGAASAVVNTPYGFLALTSNAAGRWTIVDFTGATTAQLTNRNAVINGNFAINQRGYASGTSLAANAYAHDRWKVGANGCTYTFSQSVPDTQLTITAGSLIQAVDAPNVYATGWWLTWTGTAAARIWQGSASGSFASGLAMTIGGVAVNALLVTGLTIGTIADIEFSTGTVGLVQLEAALPNAGPTRFERRHNAQELLLCQRYYQQIGIGAVYEKVAYAAAFASSYVEMFVPLPITMRANPTVTFSGSYIATGAQGNLGFSAANMATDSAYTAKISINCTTSQAGTASGAYIVQTGATGSIIGVSAEL